jgi:hypothetical protein
MTIIHNRLADKLNNPEVLTNPEKFLGPNYETVLNFWKYVESLDQETHKMIERRFSSTPLKLDLINRLCDKVFDRLNVDSQHLFLACSYLENKAVARATYELILMDQLLDEGYTMTFLPMFEV